MDWNQIETKWAVMARRIRADVQCGKTDESMIMRRRRAKDDVARKIVAKENAAASTEGAQKRNPASTS